MQQVSIWEEQSFYAPQDVIIVGAGFTGLWVALHLREKYPQKKISIIEKGLIPSGASGRNAGFACFGSLTEILQDIKAMGAQKTLQLVNMRFEGLKMIKQYVEEARMDYHACGGYELLNDFNALERLDMVNTLLYPVTGMPRTFVQNDAQIETFGFAHTKYLAANAFEGALHSGKLLMTLTRMVQSMGVQIFYGTELKQYQENPGDVNVYTHQEVSFKTRQLIFCTNAFTKTILRDIDLAPARGQVLLTEPIQGLKVKGVFHYDEGFYYFRNLDGCILLGGARNSSFETEFTLDNMTTLPIQQALENFLSQVVLPGQKPGITHRWAGIMAMGSDKFPIVKRLTDRTSCAVKLSGMGVALAPMIGKMVARDMPLF